MDESKHKDLGPPARQGIVNHTFRALNNRNYQLYFSGQLVSLIGTWMQMVALPWLVSGFPGANARTLGLVGFAGQIPGFLLSPIGGLAADRFNRKRIILVTQSLAMIQAFVLSALVLTHNIHLWEVIVLSVFIGIVNAFDMPTRQSFVVDMTQDKETLRNAIALNSSMFNGARLFGPWIAGVLIHIVGTGWCFFINGASFIAVLAGLILMNIPLRRAKHSDGDPAWMRVKEGFRYASQSPPIKYLLMLLLLVSLVGMPYTVLMPLFAKKILHGDSKTFGLLLSASGIGALVGALYLASRRSIVGLGAWIPIATTMFGGGLIAFSLSRHVWLSCIILSITGFGMIVQMAASNTIIQTIVDEDKRGRVMSIYTMAFLGAAPFGSLIAGYAGARIGPPMTVLIGGVLCIVAAALFATRLPLLRTHVRPIYAGLGIIPGAGIGPEAELHAEDRDKSG